MTTENLTLLQGFNTKIDWLEQRQKTLAANIANSDTPHYRPNDLVAPDFKDLLKKSTSHLSLTAAGGQVATPASPSSPQLAATNAAHMGLDGVDAGKTNTKGEAQKQTYEIAPAGNSVVLEEQLMKMSQNYTDHQLMTNLYAKNISMLKTSLK